MFRNPLPVAIAVLATTILLFPSRSSAQVERLAIPPREAQDEALELIKSIFAKEYASTDAKDRIKLAKVLLDQARKPENDAASQFTLLKEAVLVAADAGDIGTTLAAVETMVAKFQVDGVSVKSYALAKLAKSVAEPAACKQVTAACFALVDELLTADNFKAAGEALDTAEAAARKSRDSQVIADVRTAARDVQEARAEFEKVAAYVNTLRDNPTDPQANLEMGKYECFVRGDWDAGLPLLALGGDEALSEIATRSIAAAAEPQQRFDLANAWWDLAEKRTGDERKAIQSYALTIYREVAPDLVGLSKTVAEKRISDAAEAAPNDDRKVVGRRTKKDDDKPRVINLLQLVNLDQDAQPRDKWAVQNKLLQCVRGSFVPKVTFPYRPPAEYDVKYVFAQPRLRNAVGVTLPNGHGDSFAFGIGDFGGDASLLTVDGRIERQTVRNLVQPGAKYTVVVKVRKTVFQVYVNGKQLLNLPTDYTRLRTDSWHRIGETSNLAIFCDDPTVFYQVEVNEVSGRGTITRQVAKQ
jgi:tetratricopeptide (TPR) repeat protein